MALCFSSWSEFYAYMTCVALGLSILMPINALLSAPRYMVDYYRYVTGDPNAKPNIPVFWTNILTFYNVVSLGTQIVFGFTVLTRFVRGFSLTTRFIFAFVCMMLEILVMALLPVGGWVSQTGAMVVFLVVTFVAAVGKSYLEATCYVLVGNFPPRFMSAVMFGCGFSGLIASSMRCIIKASMEDTYESVLIQAHIYFGLTLFVMLAALVMTLLLRFNSFAQEHVSEYRVLKLAGEVAAAGNRASGGTEPLDRVPFVDDAKTGTAAPEAEMTTAERLVSTSVWSVVKVIHHMQIACFLCFFIVLFIIPTLVIPVDRQDNWFSTIAILLYNCGDALGRFLTSFRVLWVSQRTTLIASIARFLFVPLMFLCVYGYIPGHAPVYVFVFFVGLTNFFGALSMVHGTSTEGLETEGQRLMAGQLMGISLLAGGSFGALIALAAVFGLP